MEIDPALEAAYTKLDQAITTFLHEAQEADIDARWHRDGEVLGDWVLVIHKESMDLIEDGNSAYCLATSQAGRQAFHRTEGLLKVAMNWSGDDDD